MAAAPRLILTVTIDVERDCGPGWRGSSPIRFRSVVESLPDRLVPLFADYGVRPTYLVSPEVLEYREPVDVLRSLAAGGELGTHLHGEFVEPEKTFRGRAYDRAYTAELQSDYPPSVERAKLATLTQTFTDAMDARPVSFRAGRFASGPSTFGALRELGYLVDTSCTPGVSWRYETGIVDHTDAPREWFVIGGSETNDRAAMIEIPPTIEADLGWLRPSYNVEERLCEIVRRRAALAETRPQVLNVMFHSQEFFRGASPYAATEEECRILEERLRAIFTTATALDAVPLTLRETRDALWGAS